MHEREVQVGIELLKTILRKGPYPMSDCDHGLLKCAWNHGSCSKIHVLTHLVISFNMTLET
jgi:hypothetical protein